MRASSFIILIVVCCLPLAIFAQELATNPQGDLRVVDAANPAADTLHSEENTILGQIEILKMDGKARDDRSNIVVFLDHVDGHFVRPATANRPVLSQRNRSFEPRVLPIMKGTTVDFPNEDTIFHNVFSLSRAKPMDLDVYPPGKSKSVTFKQAGWVKVYCNIHPKMVAHVIVLNNPFFSLTNKNGEFEISGIPDGSYLLRTWHEFGEEIRRTVTLAGATAESLSIEIQENKRFVQHKNKFGSTYSSKY